MIEVQSLSRYYGTHRAVHDVSFTIGANTVVGFLGLNGAGKTTTLKVIAGLLSPSSGEVRIDGVDMTTASVDFRKRIGFLPETPPLYTEMTVTDFLHHVGRVRNVSSELDSRLPDVVAKCNWPVRNTGSSMALDDSGSVSALPGDHPPTKTRHPRRAHLGPRPHPDRHGR